MHHKRLILFLFAALWLIPFAAEATDMPCRHTGSISRPVDEISWDDIGMRDLLAANGQSVVAPPTTMRTHQDATPDVCPTAPTLLTVRYRTFRTHLAHRALWMRGYIYLIQCLRL